MNWGGATVALGVLLLGLERGGPLGAAGAILVLLLLSR